MSSSPGTKVAEQAAFALPFSPDLDSDRPRITVERVDFSKTKVPEYQNAYAIILNNVFSKAECDKLVAAAIHTTGGAWERALINTGGNNQELRVDVRNCDRVIFDNRDVAAWIWSRIKEHVPELEVLEKQPQVTGDGPAKRSESWRMTRLNERLRFLKYGPGEYFNVHCDGTYETPDGKERSYYTLHLYLNESGPENRLVGGATSFHGFDMEREYNVYPRAGRVLIFQHRDLRHSGQEVIEGMKLTMRTDLMFALSKNLDK